MPIQTITLDSVSPQPLPVPGGTATVTFGMTGNYTGDISIYATPVGGGTPVLVGTATVSNPSGNHTYTATITLDTSDLDPDTNYNFVARGPGGSPTSNTVGPVDVIPCFAEGTLITTARGEVRVEDLRVGDLVVTPHGNAPLQPVIWLGHSRVNLSRHANPEKAAPILIKAGALADGVPHRDLRVSPDHAMYIDGMLVPARLLVNGASIVQQMWCPEVTYWHVELPAHGLLVSEGAVSESYLDDGNRRNFDNFGITTLFKDFGSERHNGLYAANACKPLVQPGAALDRIVARIAARVGRIAERKRRRA